MYFEKKTPICLYSRAPSFAYNIVIVVNKLDHIDIIKNSIRSRQIYTISPCDLPIKYYLIFEINPKPNVLQKECFPYEF